MTEFKPNTALIKTIEEFKSYVAELEDGVTLDRAKEIRQEAVHCEALMDATSLTMWELNPPPWRQLSSLVTAVFLKTYKIVYPSE